MQNTPFGPLKMDEVFVFYDGPRLFSCRTGSGAMYLTMFADETDASEDWLLASVTTAQLAEAKAGSIDLRSLIENSTRRGAFLVRFDKASGSSAIQLVFSNEPIPGEYLPEPGVSLMPSTQLKTSTSSKIVQRLVVRSGTQPNRTLSLSAVGKVSELWSTLLGSFEYQGQELGELFALGATTGSVVLELGCASPQLVPLAVKAVVDSLALSTNPKKLRAGLRDLPIDAFNLASLLESIVDGSLHLVVDTVGSRPSVEISAEVAAKAARALRTALATTLATSEVPQADVLQRLFRLVDAIQSEEVLTEASTGIVTRQIAYYKHAARTLGYLDDQNAVTTTGEHLLRAGAPGRLALTATQFENSRCGAAWLRWSKVNQLPSLKPESATAFLKDTTILSDSTASRRAMTLSAWLVEVRDHHYSKTTFVKP